MSDHALGEQATKWLVDANSSKPLERAGPEARVEKVQDRMLDAADILANRQPLFGLGAIERLVRRLARKSDKIPARIDEGVERVRLARRLAAAGRAMDILPGRMAVERIAGFLEIHVL